MEIGIFKEYLRETKPALTAKCFEFDWSNMKQIKFKKSSMEDMKAEMHKAYPMIKEAYRV